MKPTESEQSLNNSKVLANTVKPVSQSTSNEFEKWRYFVGVGGQDKDRMITISTWLLAFGAAILGYIVTKGIDYGGILSLKQPLEVFFLSSVGIFICVITGYVISRFADHANRHWWIADRILEKIPDVHLYEEECKKTFGPARRSQNGWAPIFKVFMSFDVTLGLIFVFCFVAAVISKR